MHCRKLRNLLEAPGIIRAVGCGNPWEAKLIEKAGFPAVYLSGAQVSRMTLGRPDIGLTTMTEMALAAKNISLSTSLPVIADADNGYGGILNVVRTVEEYERAGVAAIQLEDQVFPKRCGHMDGKEVITREEMVYRIRAAVDARKNPDFVIIARTDARAVNGFDDALERANAYAEAGADVIFFEAPQSVEEMQALNKAISLPTLANMVEKGKTPFLRGAELEAMGYKIVIYPGSCNMAATYAALELLESLKTHDTTEQFRDRMLDFVTMNQIAKLAEERAREKTYIY